MSIFPGSSHCSPRAGALIEIKEAVTRGMQGMSVCLHTYSYAVFAGQVFIAIENHEASCSHRHVVRVILASFWLHFMSVRGGGC
jgi:hypothetical protein